VSEVRGLTKRHGDVLAFDDLTFDVEPGAGGALLLGWLRLVRDDANR